MRLLLFLLLLVSSSAQAGAVAIYCTPEQDKIIQTTINQVHVYVIMGITNVGSPIFLRWFSKDDELSVKNTFLRMKNVLDNNSLIIDCTPAKEEERFTLYASVFREQPYVIYLGDLFWTAPLDGIDSKVGVIIHELSHFNEIRGAFDIAGTYNESLRLARLMGQSNANNYEYYVEELYKINSLDR